MADWISARLGEVTTKIGSGATPLGGEAAYKAEGTSLIRSLNVHDGEFRYKDLARIDGTQSARLGNVVVEPNDVLLNITGASVARCCVVPHEVLPARVNQHVAIVRPKANQLWPEFLQYMLVSDEYKQRLLDTGEGAGSTRQALTKAQLEGFVVKFPPSLSEQQRIVAILDEAFEGIATAKANTEKNLQNARDLFAGYANNAFLQIAYCYPIKTLNQLAENLDSKRVPISKSYRTSGTFPYYGASGIVDYVDDYLFDGDALLISEDGANLLARSTPIAFPATGRYWVNNHAHILKFEHMATQRFVEFFLESIPLDDYITGAAQPKLNQKALNSIPIPIPISTEEQAQVVARLDRVAEQCESLEATYQRKLAALDELKKSLLHQAFSGQL